MQTIPSIDIRNGDLTQVLAQHADGARRLIEASRNTFGVASRLGSRVALPVGDYLSKRWLEQTQNPYREEIAEFARIAAMPGIFALNLCYEWGCTSGVYRNGSGATLTRVLDWPFPGLGEHIVVAHQKGAAGEFYNMTWPGVSGVFHAMAPGRFAAALNQAPMRRYRTGMVVDWARNRVRMGKAVGLPPAHLLRKTFETARDYAQAKAMLCEEPVSLPVIYILSGTKPDEGCVIERIEKQYAVREMDQGRVCAANHFESWLNGIGHGWQPRAIDSHARIQGARAVTEADADFGWFQPPMANVLSRLAMTADAGRNTFSLMGTNGVQPVTQVFQL